MDIEDILLEAIESNQFIEFLRGEGKFKIEMWLWFLLIYF